jgi:competence protein ComEA
LDGTTLAADITENGSVPAEFALFFHRPLPLNKSRLEDLTMLPGIGPHRAALLIAARQQKGRLEGPEDLLAVPGIGPATLGRLLPLVSFE